MNEFTLFPAIDLRGGRVVRLQQGDPNRLTVFSEQPAAVARQWTAAGARWLHVVNLDGALTAESRANWDALLAIVATGAHVQFGGGLRSQADIERALNAGVDRVILGTAAVEQPDLVEEAAARFGGARIAVALDARDGLVRTRGWTSDSALPATTLGRQMHERGVEMAIHTDIGRDGILTGANVAASLQLARESGLKIIVSGGVAGLDDVAQAASRADEGLVGLIIGRALYEKRFSLAEAIQTAKETQC